MNQPTLSIIVTSLNEEANITGVAQGVLAAFDELHIDGELILVDDGSTDGTTQISRDMAARDSRVVMVRHEKPCGVGASFWDGVDKSHGTFVCWVPGDHENPPREIIQYLPLTNQVDLVIPFTFNKWVRSRMRNCISNVYRFILNTTFSMTLNYTNGTGIIRKSLLDALPTRNTGFFFLTDIYIRLIKQGYLFAEVPYRLAPRFVGESKAISCRSLRRVACGYLRLVYDYYFDRKRKIPRELVADSRSVARYNECNPPKPR
jgi:glycosyltransferase involved in cell wall biosynthesis